MIYYIRHQHDYIIQYRVFFPYYIKYITSDIVIVYSKNQTC